MISSTALVIAALAAAGVLLVQMPKQLWPIVGAVAAGLEALIRFNILRLSLRGIDLWLVLGAALVLAGGMAWMKSNAKTAVTAATVLALVGAVQVLDALRV